MRQPFIELVSFEHIAINALQPADTWCRSSPSAEQQMEFGRLADRPHRIERVIHILGDLLLGRVVLRRDVDGDAVVGPVDFAAQERLVVERVVPGCRAGT